MLSISQVVSSILRNPSLSVARSRRAITESSFTRIATSTGALALTASLSLASLAHAQEAPAASDNGDAVVLEAVTITGSRIRTTDGMVTPTPVTVVTPDELSSLQPGSGISEQLNSLPQFFGNGSAQRGGAALFGDGGGSYLNMRNLGTNRTLVLLDGSRVVPADKRGTVNVDTLPTALIRSVDVVTGGASATYGADALGGVTNFVLNREFQGLKTEFGTGATEMGDGVRWNASIAGGTKIGEKIF
jgi:outer membrane receptor protein involved in Fe transport